MSILSGSILLVVPTKQVFAELQVFIFTINVELLNKALHYSMVAIYVLDY